MFLSISIRDGALGFIPTEATGLAVIAPAGAGPLKQVQPITDPKRAYDIFVRGKLPDRIAMHFGASGPGPVYALRPATSTAGTIPSYQETLSAALAGNNALNAFAISAQPSDPRNVEVTFAGGWDGGNVTVNGTGEDDAAITEVITAAAGTTVKGLRVFKSITSAAKGAVGAAAATAQIFAGNKSTEGATTTNAKLALSGTPTDDFEVVVQVTRAGDVASGDPAAKYSFDGGDTWTAERAIPAGGVYAGFATSHGLTFTFVGTLLKVGDEFRQRGTGPAMTTGDLTDALDALHTDPALWEMVHICGSLTGAQAAAVEAWLVAALADGRPALAIGESRDFTAAEAISPTGNATWQASVKADYAAVLSAHGQLAVVPSYIETVVPGKGVYRRNGAWAAATQISRLPISTHPGAVAEAGPLRGVFKPADGPGLYQDERTDPGMGGSVGRFLTLQTLLGRPGQFFIGDHQGMRGAGTMAAGDSDYGQIPYARLIMKLYRLMQVVGTRYLARKLRCKTNGTLLESQAKVLDAEVTSFLKTFLVDAGDCVSARAVFSRSQNVLSTKILPVDVFVLPFGYAEEVLVSIGFEKIL